MRSLTRVVWLAGVAAAVVVAPAFAQSAPPPPPPPVQTPVPKPFPGANPPAQNKPVTPSSPAAVAPKTGAAQEGAPVDPRLTGVPIYPGAEMLASFKSGTQQVFLFGSSMPYADIVAYYKTQLRSGGNEVFRMPPIQQFDLGSFRSETMDYRPSVVVKDYGAMEPVGYLHVTGTTEKRYRTVIQIVPVK